MLDRYIPVLRITCAILLAWIAILFARHLARPNPIAQLQLPRIPSTPTSQPTITSPTKESPSNPNPASPTPPSPAAPGRKPATPPPPLPPQAQARVRRIRDSGALGMIPRPMPTALLGIAGPDAFIRTAQGQTGLIREGESLGSLKLLRIGTNRVLVEESGKTNELTIFAGFGGDSLLPKPSNSSTPP